MSSVRTARILGAFSFLFLFAGLLQAVFRYQLYAPFDPDGREILTILVTTLFVLIAVGLGLVALILSLRMPLSADEPITAILTRGPLVAVFFAVAFTLFVMAAFYG